MGTCASLPLGDAYLPQLTLDGSTLDVAVRRTATRILLLRIRPQDQTRIRQIQTQQQKKVAIEVLVTVPQGALCKETMWSTRRGRERARSAQPNAWTPGASARSNS